ncbi:DinB family protein [Algoriphagus sp. NBT04N3]|jgi:hypothetical protein|uniref:DinB family protein n=1 Tax=Algoriphagus sp. NBT04N3 TaxID=2705473 RepID=UPI001C62B02A|nr:DinB family protein [Algoriphagus sp. NBT04N3]QYH38504.1 DinB family protein [Algoriphagus sp. NBT04N3]
MIKELIELFERDLKRLEKELEAFKKEENLWKTQGGISNTAGNLILHLNGNLRTFICKEIGGFDYTRDRDFEFAGKGVSREKMRAEIELVSKQLVASLEGLNEETLNQPYPEEKFGYSMTYNFFLMHLYGHFNYHLGQINYLRRILEG